MAWDRLALNNPELQYIEVAVSDVPEAEHPALAVFDPADAGYAARITVYRWAIELRADSSRHLLHHYGFSHARSLSFKRIAKAGHYVMLEQPVMTASVLLAFGVTADYQFDQ